MLAYPLDIFTPHEHRRALIGSCAVFAKNARAAIANAGEAGDEAHADLFTEISREADRALWMLEAHRPGG